MTKISFYTLLLFLFSSSVNADECYEAYSYKDRHQVTTTIDKSIVNEEVEINATLHVRSFDENGTSYKIFWLENGEIEKEQIKLNSIYVPFLVQIGSINNEFIIESMKTLSHDKFQENKLLGIIDILQFRAKDGQFTILNRNGTVDVNQTTKKNIVSSSMLKQYKGGIPSKEVQYLYSQGDITLNKGCSLWKRIKLEEELHFDIPLMKSTMEDKRIFQLEIAKSILSKNHWFYDLSSDLKSWGLGKKKETYSLQNALDDFEMKEQEMKALLGDSKAFEKWVRNNIEFLTHLNDMLMAKELDDGVSKKLFANLGYIDIEASTDILSQITLNIDISEKERFRSLMGLQGTSATMNETLLDELLIYGLSSQSQGDFIQNAAGMIIGTLAKNRIDRSPTQMNKITDAIIDAISTQPDKTVALSAAGNMLETAPERIVNTVDEMLLSTSDSATRALSADALSRIERSNLNTENFKNLFEKESSSSTKKELILASASAKDFKSNSDYKNLLIDMSSNRNDVKSTRVASLSTLEKVGYGSSKNEKGAIRKMMLNEKDIEISTKLRELYRR